MSQEPSWGLAFFAHEGVNCKGEVHRCCNSLLDEKRPSSDMHAIKELSGLYLGGTVIFLYKHELC